MRVIETIVGIILVYGMVLAIDFFVRARIEKAERAKATVTRVK
jgi:hypothetical protein